MNNKIIEKNGQKYLVIKGRAIPFSETDSNGKPIVKVESEEKINENGGKDVTIKIPVLKVAGDNKLN